MLELVIEKVSKCFKDKVVVKDFDCVLSNGIYGLIGPNGVGKSTLLKIIVGILRPTEGRILVNGEEIDKMSHRYRDILGYLPQSFGTYKNFRAKDFMLFFAALKGIEDKNASSKINELLKLVGLQNEINKRVGKFSGGMKKRLGIAITLLNDPKIIILDEPTAALDPNERMRFRNVISEISKDRIILLSTHIVSDIEYIAKEILLMKDGSLIRKCESKDILIELENKVWEYITDDGDIQDIKAKFKISNIMRQKNKVHVRIISEVKPFETAISIEPNLDDVYVHYFGEENNND